MRPLDAWAAPAAATAPSPVRPGFWRRWLGWPGQQPDAQQRAAVDRDRRPPGVEILLVLAVFPVGAALSAVFSLILDAVGQNGSDEGYVGITLPGHALLAAVMDVPLTLLDLVAAGLVAYLLATSGGGLTALGLDRRRVRSDLSVTGKLWFLAYLVPFGVGGIILSVGDVGDVGVVNPEAAIYLLPLLVSSVVAGIVEEIVVLGYLVHRLEQRHWSAPAVLVGAVAARVSFHLYYGIGVLPFIGWATVSVLLYRRRRRLLPFIVLHALWDICSFTSLYLPVGGASTVPYLLLGSALVLLRVGAPRTDGTTYDVSGDVSQAA